MMEKRPYLSVVVPAYKEKEKIGHNLLEIDKFLSGKHFDYEVVVIVDGSPDNTAEVARNYASRMKNLRVIENRENRGKGYVVRQGLSQCGGKYVMFLDADGSTSITHVEKFFPELEGGADMVIGSRNIEGSFIQIHQPKFREFLGWVGNLLIRIILGLWAYPDTQCGFKMFTSDCAKEITKRMKVERFGFDFEMIALAEKMGFKVKQLPVRWLNEEESEVVLFGKNGFAEALSDLFKTKWRLMTGRYGIKS